VQIEKPACLHPDEFGDLVGIAERTGAHLMLAMCNRTSPLVEDTRRIVAGDGIGRVYAARVLALADQTRIWSERRRDWTFDNRETPGGHLVFLGIHWLDALLHITGDRVEAVQAQIANVGGGPISVEDVATLNLRLASGAHASMLSGYVLDQGKQLGVSLWGPMAGFGSISRPPGWSGTVHRLRRTRSLTGTRSTRAPVGNTRRTSTNACAPASGR
jgi:predicted dehydrogenase